jgi:hypothetical protein
MSNERFTPGPWKIYYPGRNKGMTVILDSREDCYVATIDEENSMPVDANAYLIASAPDMYYLLNDVLKIFDSTTNDPDQYELLESIRATMEKINP